MKVSTKGNKKLAALLEEINGDAELQQLWEAANINAVRRLGMSDHGPTHIQIVANACVKILRLLVAADVQPSMVSEHGLTNEDAEVVVVLEPLALEGAMNMSLLPFVSFATRFEASESKATNAPSEEMKGR